MKKIKIYIIIFLAVLIFTCKSYSLPVSTAADGVFVMGKSCLSKRIIINTSVFEKIFSQDDNAGAKSLQKITDLDFKSKIISRDMVSVFRVKKLLKERELVKAINAYKDIENKTGQAEDLLDEIVDLGVLELDFYFGSADFEYVTKLCQMLCSIAPERPQIYLYLGAIEALEGDDAEAFRYFSFAKALSMGEPAYELLSNMMGFIAAANVILHNESIKIENTIESLRDDIDRGRYVMELGESFGFIGYKNELAIKRFVRGVYPVYMIFPVLIEKIAVMKSALARVGIDVEIGYPLEKFIYSLEQEAGDVHAARRTQEYSAQIISLNTTPLVANKNKFKGIKNQLLLIENSI